MLGRVFLISAVGLFVDAGFIRDKFGGVARSSELWMKWKDASLKFRLPSGGERFALEDKLGGSLGFAESVVGDYWWNGRKFARIYS